MIPVYTNDRFAIDSKKLDTQFISGTGPYHKKLEKQFQAKFNIKHVALASSGSAAIQALLHGLGITSGDKVIVPNFTIFTVAVACRNLGAIPVAVPVTLHDLGYCVDSLSKALEITKPRAVICCHLFGLVQKTIMDVRSLCQANNVPILDDCSQTLLDENCKFLFDDSEHIAASMYFNKLISAGEGGAIFSKSEEVQQRASAYIDLGKLPPNRRFSHELPCFNFRMHGIGAQIAIQSLRDNRKIIETKRTIKANYSENLFDFTIKEFGESNALLWM